jgi:YfiH family protein
MTWTCLISSSNPAVARPEAQPWPQFQLSAGVMAMFTSRQGGVSTAPYDSLNLSGTVSDRPEAVTRNRNLVRDACGPGCGPVSWMRQVHGTAVLRAGAPARGPGPGAEAGSATPAAGTGLRIRAAAPQRAGTGPDQEAAWPEADAQFTGAAGVPLGVLVADCAPVLVADGTARIAGVAHAGRAGLVAGVVPALLAAMTQAGASPSRMSVVIGPMICGACYEVPADLRDAVEQAVPGTGCVTRSGTPGVDIRAGLTAQLAAAGVPDVTSDQRCTAESAELYSYRRDGPTGRFAGVIWLTS